MSKLKIEYIKTGELIPYINNPRKNENAIDVVAGSIKEFGFKNPIIIDKDNVIIAGHTRLLASRKLGLEEVPVIRAEDLTEQQVKAFRLADNKTSEFAEWDVVLLTEELLGIDFDMEEFGFESINYDDFGTEFVLDDSDRHPFQSMTFTLADAQVELIKSALDLANNDGEEVETFGNGNRNGNNLYKVVKQWAEQKT